MAIRGGQLPRTSRWGAASSGHCLRQYLGCSTCLGCTNIVSDGPARFNLAIVVVQVINFWLRSRPGPDENWPILISVVAVAALVVSGWLGGQLVHVLGVSQPHHGEATSVDHDRLHPRT